MNRLLVVDDEEINRTVLEFGLNDIFEIVQAENGIKALEILYFDEKISSVLLDLNMPKMNGFDVLKDMNETGLIEKVPVFVITANNAEQDLLNAYELGAVDVISKPYNIQFLRRRLLNTIELYQQRNKLSKVVEEKTQELVRQNNRLVEAMADLVEFRSNESGAHVKRVSSYTKLIMDGLIIEYSEYEYLRPDVQYISFAACLHDLGKIAIPDSILNMPGKYTPKDFEIMKTHTIHGYEQIRSIKDIMDPKLYEYSLDITRHHHERYDGNGYPDGLKGDQISIWSQAVGLADVYDALTSERCYKNAYDHETACNMILNGECGAFNPKVIEVFKKLMNRFNELKNGIKRKKILIVDDSEIDRTTLRTMLQTNYDIYEAADGEAAFTEIKTSALKFDLAIIDVNMPEMDGFDLLRKLGKRVTTNNPYMMSSATVTKETMLKAAEYGVCAFLKKPFDYDSMIKKIESFIGK